MTAPRVVAPAPVGAVNSTHRVLPRPTAVPAGVVSDPPPANGVAPRPSAPPASGVAPTNRLPTNGAAVAGPTGAQIARRFPAPFNQLNFDPMARVDYPGNPRRAHVKGLYLTLHTAAGDRFDGILKIVDQTAINALVIDVKDDTGHMLYRSPTAAQFNPQANEKAPIRDVAAFMQRLRQRNVYAIARIVTFKDPIYAEAHPQRAIVHRRTGQLFRSRDKLAWGSPHDPAYRAYNLAIAKEAAQVGFNEVQFDYIRFPEIKDNASVDYRNAANQTKPQAIQSFLIEARRELSALRVYVSADVFGLVPTVVDDMDIGQYWEAISSAVDYISPMSYPSHYGPMNYGLPVPDLQPYELMDRTTKDGLKRNRNLPSPAPIRPWIQGFTARWLPKYKSYGVAEIRAQIRALQANGISSYLVWNPNNRYDSQKAAFE